MNRNKIFLLLIVVLASSCTREPATLLTKLSPGRTGIHFKNILKENEDANVLNYAYFYNGGGVAVGDINNDGLPDLLFTGNMVPNRLYLNKGNFNFEDITEKSGIAQKQGWCTGTTMVDINGDGKLDIYICRSGDINPEKRKNLLYINNGDLTFTEKAEEYGLADKGYSTQAAFFDYDKDGDLDMILINHSLQQYSTAGIENNNLRRQKNQDYAAKLYRNDNGHFHDVSDAAGITSNVLSFGLGVAVSDLNNDGWPDIYISNDFNEPDYLFINNKNGTFTERADECMDELSLYSMGSDCADYNNDGFVDVFTLDMLDEGNHAQKMHNGAENFNKFQMLFDNGFYYQYSRNMLHKNNGDGTFSEIGQLAGVSNTSWSWSALFADFDNDGNKDLFISNGYKKDFTDMDFIKYKVDNVVRQRQTGMQITALDMLQKMPSIDVPDKIFKNNGDNSFSDQTINWGLGENNISSGAVYADLNNDGYMDLVVSHIDEEAAVYKNDAGGLMPGHHYLKIKLLGNQKNTSGIGAKIKLYCGTDMYYQEQSPVRGFQSSVDQLLNFGIGNHHIVDSLIIIWPDDKMYVMKNVAADKIITLKYNDAVKIWKYDDPADKKKYFAPASSIAFTHKQGPVNDFSLQKLLPGFLSHTGPCMAKADINHDGLEDIFIAGGRNQPSKIFIQDKEGNFIERPEPVIAMDSSNEMISAVFLDANGDGYADLYAAHGSYTVNENDPVLQDNIYFNDGKGNFKKSTTSLPHLLFNKSCVRVGDVNGDGAPDIFIGGSAIHGKFPLSSKSCILLNDGKGNFTDATDRACPALDSIGMVSDAAWVDINGDHQPDLVVVGQWMPVKIFINDHGKLADSSSRYIHFSSTGWWNCITVTDGNGDGKPDLVLGNTGLNTQFKVKPNEPVSLYYKDFDDNGMIDPIFCYYVDGVCYPALYRDDIMDELPMIKKRFPDYKSYANATMKDLFSEGQLKDAAVLQASAMQTVYLENEGANGFALKNLPVEAQYAPAYSICAQDVNADGHIDLVIMGNNSFPRIRFGRYRANHGVLLLGDGKGNFAYAPQYKSGLHCREDVRSGLIIETKKGPLLVVGCNNATVQAYNLINRPLN